MVDKDWWEGFKGFKKMKKDAKDAKDAPKKGSPKKPADDGIGYSDLISQEAEDAILEHSRQQAGKSDKPDSLQALNDREQALQGLLKELDDDLASEPVKPKPANSPKPTK